LKQLELKIRISLAKSSNHILNYWKPLKGTYSDYAKEQYKLSASLLGLVLISQYKKEFPNDENIEN
tara:strand:- start:155 stop:352 length:198 start_codon:yes stop_codon:yes gene_type:complete